MVTACSNYLDERKKAVIISKDEIMTAFFRLTKFGCLFYVKESRLTSQEPVGTIQRNVHLLGHH